MAMEREDILSSEKKLKKQLLFLFIFFSFLAVEAPMTFKVYITQVQTPIGIQLKDKAQMLC